MREFSAYFFQFKWRFNQFQRPIDAIGHFDATIPRCLFVATIQNELPNFEVKKLPKKNKNEFQSTKQDGENMKMSIKPSLSLFAALLMAFAGLMASHSPADAAGTGCLPSSVKAKLAQIRAKFGPISVISTHRPGARIAGSGKRSYHASCRAVDFNPPRGKYSQVVAYLKRTHNGGVGTYSCAMHHIHIDNGPRVRFHHCVNARGVPIGKRRHYASKRHKRKYAKRYSKRHYAKKRHYSKKKYAKKYSSKKYAQKSYKKHHSNKRVTSRSPGAMVQAAMGS